MKLFKEFVAEQEVLTEGIRQGLPAIYAPHVKHKDKGMGIDQFHALTKGGKIDIHHVTEKTDGQTIMMGHDEHGFYTQSSGSGAEKMRTKEDYIKRAHARAKETGKEPALEPAKAFGHVHHILQNNKKLTQHLSDHYKKTGEEVKVRGESFYKPWGSPSETKKGEIKFVGTSYDPSHMGKVGKFVIHSKLPENRGHDLEHFKKNLSDEHINFDDDKIKHNKSSLDVTKHREAFDKLDHELLKARTTKTNKEAKMAELDKFYKIKDKVHKAVDHHIKSMGIAPKWGSGTEGAVIHPREGSGAPRFKVTSDAFRAYKASDEAKNFKSRVTR